MKPARYWLVEAVAQKALRFGSCILLPSFVGVNQGLIYVLVNNVIFNDQVS